MTDNLFEVSNVFQGVPHASEWKLLRTDYLQKCELLEREGWREKGPTDFLGLVFGDVVEPMATRGEDGRAAYQDTGLGRVVALRFGRDDRRPDVRHFEAGFADLDQFVTSAVTNNDAVYVAPATYMGRRRRDEDMRHVCALAIDVDYVTYERLVNLIWYSGTPINGRCLLDRWASSQAYPQPDYICVSGTGVHVYYVFDQPIKAYPSNREALRAIKRALTKALWIPQNVGEDGAKAIQYQGIGQAMRLVGTPTKLDGGFSSPHLRQSYAARAFANPHKGERPTTSVGDLVSFIEDRRSGGDGVVEEIYGSSEIDGLYVTAGDPDDLRIKMPREHGVSLAEAKELWPDWYESRIVRQEPPRRRGWVCNRALYDWWKRRVYAQGAAVYGGRYGCLYALGAYAAKCGIGWEEFSADAAEMGEYLKSVEHPISAPFTNFDIECALESYSNPDSVRLTSAYLSDLSKIPIKPRPTRRYSKKTCIAIARSVRDEKYPNGDWRRTGRPSKGELVRAFAAEHPDMNHSQIARELGISRSTVVKWLKAD